LHSLSDVAGIPSIAGVPLTLMVAGLPAFAFGCCSFVRLLAFLVLLTLELLLVFLILLASLILLVFLLLLVFLQLFPL
jgi:hypothetical protein